MNKIPSIIETYAETGAQPIVEKHDEPSVYENAEGEKILVHLWVRFPSYDFIFGVPAKDNPKYEKEFGFFQFRKMKDGKAMSGWSIYVDQPELEEMQRGFTKLMDVSHVERTPEWAEYHSKKDL